VVAGGGAVGVLGGPVGVPDGTVGSATVAVCGAVVGRWGGPPSVATAVVFFAPASARTIAAVAPATAITNPSRMRQIQSPGYHPKRSCHAADNRPNTPGGAPSR
jgi:hypothetical protein